MPDNTAHNAKKRRASAPKTRTGCGTCKIRHKRCDETKPICDICRRTGRICDGYIDPATGRQFGGHESACRISPRLGLAPCTAFANEEEAQGFRFFETATEVQLAAALQNHGWTLPLLQLSHRNPAIYHSVIANGIMSKVYEIDELSTSCDPRAGGLRQAALQQYGKAVAHFRTQLSEGDSLSLENSPACCLLLIIFEFMQGNADGVLLHLKNATKLAASVGRGPIKQFYISLFALIDMVAALWLNVDLSFSDISFPLPKIDASQMPSTPHSNLTTLSCELTDIKNNVMTWRHAISLARRNSKVWTATDLNSFSTMIQSRLDMWHYQFVTVSLTPEDIATHRCSLLRTNYLLTVLTVDTLHKQQLSAARLIAADSVNVPDLSNLQYFYEIVELTEAVLKTNYSFTRYDSGAGEESLKAVGLLPLFSFRHSFIQALFYVAQNAPYKQLRQKAVRLLLDKPWREGCLIWSSSPFNINILFILKVGDGDDIRGVEYDAQNARIILKGGPGWMHEAATDVAREVFYQIRDRLNATTGPRYFLTGSTGCSLAGDFDESIKQADASLMEYEAQWPAVVLEVGISETTSKLYDDAERWLEGSNHQTKLVILVDVQETPIWKIPNDNWGLSEIDFQQTNLSHAH